MISPRVARIAFVAILVLGFVLRLKGLSHPLLDHPGWRQGDEAAIARNFAQVDFNPLHPQADYNGPGPNYVELELQIVPWLAALGYKLFGVHEIFGRLISIAASLGTVAVLRFFGRALFADELAGLCAALLFAIAPGAVYYGRTFQPDTMMAFLLTCALYASMRHLVREDYRSWKGVTSAMLLLLAAVLAKSVAVVALVPVIAVSIRRFGFVGAAKRGQTWALVLGSTLPFAAFDAYEQSIATWKWASGITKLHVIPSLAHAATSPSAFVAKWNAFADAFGMLAHTMAGPVIFALAVLAFARPLRSRSDTLLIAWLAAGLAYSYAVVTVERVDYYLYPLLPLAALCAGSVLARTLDLPRRLLEAAPRRRLAIGGVLAAALAATVVEAREEVAPYYDYNAHNLREARLLDAQLAPGALIVLGHLDPSLLYYIHRRGWEEDPYLWTPFDEQSAIRKGARYFIAAEPARLARNVELSAWLERFPTLRLPKHAWTVYVTDPHRILPGAEQRWRAFRARERASKHRPRHGGKGPSLAPIHLEPADNALRTAEPRRTEARKPKPATAHASATGDAATGARATVDTAPAPTPRPARTRHPATEATTPSRRYPREPPTVPLPPVVR